MSYDVSFVKPNEMDKGLSDFCDRVAASRWRRDPGWIPSTGDLPGAKPSAFVWKRSVIADRSIEWGGRWGAQGGGMARRWVRHDGGYTQRTLRREGEGGWEDGGGLERLYWTGLDGRLFGWWVG